MQMTIHHHHQQQDTYSLHRHRRAEQLVTELNLVLEVGHVGVVGYVLDSVVVDVTNKTKPIPAAAIVGNDPILKSLLLMCCLTLSSSCGPCLSLHLFLFLLSGILQNQTTNEPLSHEAVKLKIVYHMITMKIKSVKSQIRT
jgi:hypothetical protein